MDLKNADLKNADLKNADLKQKPVITGESQITISKKWIAIVVGIVVVFTVGVGWMFQITAVARPVTTEYAKQHSLK